MGFGNWLKCSACEDLHVKWSFKTCDFVCILTKQGGQSLNTGSNPINTLENSLRRQVMVIGCRGLIIQEPLYNIDSHYASEWLLLITSMIS